MKFEEKISASGADWTAPCSFKTSPHLFLLLSRGKTTEKSCGAAERGVYHAFPFSICCPVPLTMADELPLVVWLDDGVWVVTIIPIQAISRTSATCGAQMRKFQSEVDINKLPHQTPPGSLEIATWCLPCLGEFISRAQRRRMPAKSWNAARNVQGWQARRAHQIHASQSAVFVRFQMAHVPRHTPPWQAKRGRKAR